MDRRGRLAYSLMPIHGTLARARRVGRRWLSPILDLEIPHGIGSSCAVLIVLGSIAYGVIAGGHIPEIATEMRRACDALAGHAGFRVAAIALDGEREVNRSTILELAGIDDGSSLLCLDASASRAALTRNPWIADATVLKLYPGNLQISVIERSPIALWQKDGRVRVIADDGTVLEDFNGGRFANLPLVVGAGAEHAARNFLDVVARYPMVRDTLDASVLIAQRRWNLRLKSGIDVKLPDNDVEQALQTLVSLDRDKKIFSRDITTIDLRLPDRVIVRLSDEAAQARAEAIKEQQKKQQKKKGSDA